MAPSNIFVRDAERMTIKSKSLFALETPCFPAHCFLLSSLSPHPMANCTFHTPQDLLGQKVPLKIPYMINLVQKLKIIYQKIKTVMIEQYRIQKRFSPTPKKKKIFPLLQPPCSHPPFFFLAGRVLAATQSNNTQFSCLSL